MQEVFSGVFDVLLTLFYLGRILGVIFGIPLIITLIESRFLGLGRSH